MGAPVGAVIVTLCVAFLLLNVSNLRTESATTFSAKNLAPATPGGMRYAVEMGDAWTIKMLGDVRKFIVKELSLSYRPVDHVTFIVEDTDISAYNSNNEIHVGAKYLAGSEPGTLRSEMKEIMYHSLCHSFQNYRGDYGNDEHFRGVIEGIASYMELAAGDGFDADAGSGFGDNVKAADWYEGYDTTAHFFAWIEKTQTKKFVNRLNQRMGQQDWNDDFFVHLTGKNVDALWALYQDSIRTTKG